MLAQHPGVDDRFYRAIRGDDLGALGALVAERGANVRSTAGLTPLMMAAAFGSPAAVKLLVEAGAAVNAAGAADLTALHLALNDESIVRLLIEHGANVHARSVRGRTPLLIAASANGTANVVKLLVEKGADVNAADGAGLTPLIAAAAIGNGTAARLLLEKGADARAGARDGQLSTALMGAASHGDAELTRLLLAHKPDVAAASPAGSGIVKNGTVAFGGVSALHFAVIGHNPDVVALLLDAGSPIDLKDMRGMTPLMFAVATDHVEPRTIRMLLDRGASKSLKTPENETAIDWARKYNNPAVLDALEAGATPARGEAAAGAAVPAHVPRTPREAVERSMPLLRVGALRMMSDGGCVACHAQPMTSIAADLAVRRGWRAEPAPEPMAQMAQQLNGVVQGLLQIAAGGGAPEAQLYQTLAMHVAGVPATPGTDALVFYLTATQNDNGMWQRPTPNRGPIQDGNVSRTALAIRTLVTFGPPARKAELAKRVARAADWLAKQTPASTEDRVMQLLGLSWAAAEPSKREQRTNELLALQRHDGGWAQTPYLTSDAYATGQALYTLIDLGIQPSHAAIQRGVRYLLSSQRDDGTWHVRTRAMPIQPYFESGFPYKHDQWISQSGTAWAAMGLAAASSDQPPAPTSAR
jgi:ankyrin repeat protein